LSPIYWLALTFVSFPILFPASQAAPGEIVVEVLEAKICFTWESQEQVTSQVKGGLGWLWWPMGAQLDTSITKRAGG